MNQKKLLIILIFSFFLSGCTKKSDNTANSVPAGNGDTTTSQVKEDESFTGSLYDAIKLGTGMKCTYTLDGKEYEGYVKGKNYRGKVVSQGQVTEVIMSDNCMWTWGGGLEQGIKTCYDPEEADEMIWQGQEEETSVNTGDVSYRCTPSVISDDLFNPPADQNFMDVQEMMQNLPNMNQ